MVACPLMRSPAGLPRFAGHCLQDRLARASALRASAPCAAPILSAVLPFGFAQIGVLGAHPPLAYSPACARQFGCAFGQKPAHLVSVALFPNPPETRKVSGNASFPSFSRSVSTDYRLLTQKVKRFVLADKDCVLDSNPALVGGMRTDKLFSLHSFITVT